MISPKICPCIHPFFPKYAPVSTLSSYCIGYRAILTTGPLYYPKCTLCTGEIYPIPFQLNAEQVQVLRAQMMGGAGSLQPIVTHTAPIQTQLAQPAQTVQTIQLQGGQQMYNIQ